MKELLNETKKAVESAQTLIGYYDKEVVKYQKYKDDAEVRAKQLADQYQELLSKLNIKDTE